MSYREDREALLERIRALEEEISSLRMENDRVRADLAARIEGIAARVAQALAPANRWSLTGSARDLLQDLAGELEAAQGAAAAFHAEANPLCPECGSRPAGWKYVRDTPDSPLVKRLLCEQCGATY